MEEAKKSGKKKTGLEEEEKAMLMGGAHAYPDMTITLGGFKL